MYGVLPPVAAPVSVVANGASPAAGEPEAVAASGPLTAIATAVAEAVAPLASVTVTAALKMPAVE